MLLLLSAPIDEIKLTIKNIKQNKTIGIIIKDVFLIFFLSLILSKKGSSIKNDENAPNWLKMDVVHVFIDVFFNRGKRWRKSVYLIDNSIINTDNKDEMVTLIIVVIKTLLNPFLDIKSAVPTKNNSEYQIGVLIKIFVWIALELTVADSIQANIRHIENINKNKFPKCFPRAVWHTSLKL